MFLFLLIDSGRGAVTAPQTGLQPVRSKFIRHSQAGPILRVTAGSAASCFRLNWTIDCVEQQPNCLV